MNDDIAWAWAVGIFEGEGCIRRTYLRKKVNNYTYLRLEVQMTDVDVMERFVAVVGGKLYGPYGHHSVEEHPEYKPRWHWSIENHRAEAILDRFWPLLGERRRSRAVELGYIPEFALLEMEPAA